MTQANLPMVSVIAPCRNEAAFIEKAIKTILHSDYPAELVELLVVSVGHDAAVADCVGAIGVDGAGDELSRAFQAG